MSNQRNNCCNEGFILLLTLVFIILKLTNVISWSWLWVFSPIWISFLVGLILILIGLIIVVIAAWRWSRC